MTPPRTKVAALAFDKLDAEKGMEVKGPAGETPLAEAPLERAGVPDRRCRGPAAAPCRRARRRARERPAENLLVELLAIPEKQDLATLILIDEVLMYAREKVGLDPAWRSRLVNFFQYLTQAATKIKRLRRRRVAAGERAGQERHAGQGDRPGTVHHLPPRAGGGHPAGAQGRRGRGPPPPVLHARVDPGPRGVPPPRRRRAQGHRRPRRADREGGQGRRGAVPQELPVPPRPDRGPLHQVDPA